MRLKYIKKLTLGADKKIFFRGVSVSNSVSLWALLRLIERKKYKTNLTRYEKLISQSPKVENSKPLTFLKPCPRWTSQLRLAEISRNK